MPGVTLHFVLAKQALDRWQRSKVERRVDLHRPAALNAFLHGAIGPDLGYLPGGYRLLSDLAHCVRTGALTTELIRSARTPTERAFAWGWLTHVVADRLMHPAIGRGVGELARGCRKTFVAGSEDPLSHLRVEIGVDCWYALRHPEVRRIRLQPVFDATSIAFLERAYVRTYGAKVPRNALLASHRSVGRRAGQALSSMRIVGALMEGTWPRWAVPGLKWMLEAAYRTRPLRGFSLAYLNPVKPSPWLLDELESAARLHGDRLLEAAAADFVDVGDFDLDTGAPLGRGRGHAGTRRALDGLAVLRGLSGAGHARGRAASPVALAEA